ncbi:hypothetical protein E1B28_001945 [Marasmius oreades]|uniref:Zn(2)-C6 fungal-type domain-containing protein n=1 Tax=Marasmius oreades TaxID=181124 RepID=A0A9P7V4E4_9AGAR|nr:uncharacterized protein E1B28_001945 [Marasmius oreades]KAG7100165.1 hypothetical protein E1B28_001945 [Marasmius oreades]
MGVAHKEKEKDAQGRRRPGRVPTSCAECRRLKLRCDKKVPCEKCVSRGCGAICPDGSLTTWKGNRLVLANTAELHERIDTLCGRIRELETALRTLQIQVSDEPHPLLSADLLQLKAPQSNLPPKASSPATTDPQTSSPASCSPPEEPQDMDEDEILVDAFGTLSIGVNGESTFLGKTARSEFLIRALSRPPNYEEMECPRISKKIMASSCTDSEKDPESLGGELLSMLPTLSEAIRLCEVYLEHGKYFYSTVPRSELFDEVLLVVYRAGNFSSIGCHHTVALLFSVFALASLFDNTRTPYNIEAQEYFYLSRATSGLDPPTKRTTLRMCQAMLHMAQYLELSDWQALGTNAALPVAGHAVRLAVSIALRGYHYLCCWLSFLAPPDQSRPDLNGARWKLPEEIQQRRNRVFWSLFANDTWSSFSYGRPPNLSPVYVDCPFPKDCEEFVNAEGEREFGFHTWVWKYSAFMHTIMETAFACTIPTYAKVLELDRNIRDFPVPPHLRIRCGHEPRADLIMQRYMVLCYKDTVLLNLHRAYLAQALLDQPHDLTNHRFVPSVMATYRSAWRLMKGLKQVQDEVPDLAARYNLAWSQALSATIVMCILITRAPQSKMVNSALEGIDDVAKVFEVAAPTCRSASNILDTILNLQRKAHEAVDQAPGPPDPTRCFLDLSSDELDRLGGRTQLVLPEEHQQQPGSNPASLNGLNAKQSPPPTTLGKVHNTMMAEQGIQDMHPTIAQDMRSLDSLGGPVLSFYDGQPSSTAESSFHMNGNTSNRTAPHSDIDSFMDNHNQFGEQLHLFGSAPNGMFSALAHPPTSAGGTGHFGVGEGAPILDATWHSFVEQLGF